MRALAILLFVLFFPLAAVTAPITYDVHRVVYYPFSPEWQTFWVDGWITTDGTMGEWGQQHHLTDWDLRLRRNEGTDGGWLTPETSTVAYTWGIHATETDLFFRPYGLYGDAGSAFFAILTPSHEDAWVLTSYCSREGLCDENVQTDYWSAQIGRSRPGQSYAFATAAAAVPEPSSAMLMLAGLLAIRRWCRR